MDALSDAGLKIKPELSNKLAIRDDTNIAFTLAIYRFNEDMLHLLSIPVVCSDLYLFQPFLSISSPPKAARLGK